MKSCEFKTANDWYVCSVGRTKIVTGESLSHVENGRTTLVGDRAEAWINAHEKIRLAYDAWLAARRQAAEAWKRETPHHACYCDGGSLAVQIDGRAVLKISNGRGDGSFRVYTVEGSGVWNADKPDPSALTHSFRFTGVSVEDCRLDVLQYDCGEAETVCTLVVKDAYFYADGSGDVVIKYTAV